MIWDNRRWMPKDESWTTWDVTFQVSSSSSNSAKSLATDTLAVAETGQCSHDQDKSDIDCVSWPGQLLQEKTGIDHRELTLPKSLLQIRNYRLLFVLLKWTKEASVPHEDFLRHQNTHCIYFQQLIQLRDIEGSSQCCIRIQISCEFWRHTMRCDNDIW